MKNNNFFIMIIFFIVSIFISLTFNSLESAYEIAKENNLLHSNKSFKMEISHSNITNNDFYNIIENIDNLYLETSNIECSTYYGKAIYYNYELNNIPPLIKGQFINSRSIDNEKQYCVIGKNLENLIKVINNNKYISINGCDYLVIGIMGNKNRITAFDDTFFVNINKNIPININSKWLIDGVNPTDSYNIIKNQFLKKNKDTKVAKISVDSLKSSMINIIENRSYMIIMMGLVILTLLLNIVNSTNSYILKRKKEFGIRRTFGATKRDIYKKIIFDYQIMAFKSFIISQIIYIFIVKFNNIPYILGEKLMFRSSICTFLMLLIIGTIISIIPIKKSNKFEPSQVMKGI